MEKHQCRILRWNVSYNLFGVLICGSFLFNGRHVQKTGEIKDFVITEESGIAKGIRRVVAVTGHEAAEVRRVADSLKVRLDQLEAMDGKEKDTGLKAYQVVRVCDTSAVHPTEACHRNSTRLTSP